MKHILIIKHGALGDIIQGIDAFASLREGFKDAHITMMTSPAFASLMKQMPYFDEVFTDNRAPVWQLTQLFRIKALFQRPLMSLLICNVQSVLRAIINILRQLKADGLAQQRDVLTRILILQM